VFVIELKLNDDVLSCIATMKRLLCHSLHRSGILIINLQAVSASIKHSLSSVCAAKAQAKLIPGIK
jgi:hypothetical protein